MTVAELIAKLQAMPQDMTVILQPLECSPDCEAGEANQVWLRHQPEPVCVMIE